MRKMLQFFRRLWGTEQILHQQQVLTKQLRQQYILLLSLGNGLGNLLSAPEKIKMSDLYKRCAEIVSLLSPMEIYGGKYIRVGRDYDGGYIMSDCFEQGGVEAAYGFGLGYEISWEESVANRGIEVFAYDHTVDRLPKHHTKLHFFKTGATGLKKGPNLKTLSEIIAENGHAACRKLIMKMDVEGCEWDIFRETSQDVIDQFSQIVIEFHGLSTAVYDPRHLIIVDVLTKLNQTHQCVHVHANAAYGPIIWIGELVLPQSLEVTYVRRSDVRDKLIANTRQFPTEIDQTSIPGYPDLYLGSFFANKGAVK